MNFTIFINNRIFKVTQIGFFKLNMNTHTSKKSRSDRNLRYFLTLPHFANKHLSKNEAREYVKKSYSSIIRQTTQFKNWQRFEQIKEDTQMANKYTKRCMSLIIRKMQIKITRYYLMPIRIVNLKRLPTPSIDEDVD